MMTRAHAILKYTRLAHLYVGVFISPAILFFAFTGALQTFSLHETTRGSSYKPPAWAVIMAQIHKKQTPIVPVRKPPAPDKPTDKTMPGKTAPEKPQLPPAGAQPVTDSPAKPSSGPTPAAHNAMPLKIFFLVVSIGLFASTLSGLYMSYKFIRNRRLITALLLAGIIVPIVLTIF